MAKAMFLAWASPVDEASEAEFNEWYEGTHIPQVRSAIPAITAVHRYRLADLTAAPGGAPPARRYLAVYELDTDDVASAAAALGAADAEGRMDMTPTMDLQASPPDIQWYLSLPG
jgi:EthD domain